MESRLCRLGGQFAGIIHLTLPAESLSAWKAALQDLEDNGLSFIIADDDDAPVIPQARKAVFEILGQDQPGIVQKLSAELAKHSVNVSVLESECVSAPWSGEPMFTFKAGVEIPETCDLNILRQDLEKIAADLMVDISFG